ncbi:cilia- and flagella-associated protein 45-like [Adelges cooleyi]|uniref:cilia- and flagella-associated protein 45-like n=1 Tax=Adelges cooleyi TaxID=133065 RepID=UPI00217F3D96|nr:cilia- and flagella-associated protein 45-like [Adelges cooleyi]
MTMPKNHVRFDENNRSRTAGNQKRHALICKLDRQNKPLATPPDLRVIDRVTFGRLKNKSVVVTAEERRMLAERLIAERERLENESAARKKQLLSYDNLRAKGKKLAQLDDEANKKSNYLLARAHQLRQDQEDEIKCCNSLILGTKCHAIRNAQIAEKQLIQREMKEEERRMEKIMEQERILAAKEYEKAAEMDQLKKKLQAMEIEKQIKENEIAREMENARIAEEARVRTEAAIEAQREEVKDYKSRMERQAALRKEFLQLNAQLRDMKKIEQEMNTIEMLQIQEYTRKKNEREAAFEEETRQQKLLKDKTLAKIQASHQASQDMQAAKDELNALRIRDAVEREWRHKERTAALKRAKDEEELKKARHKQIEDQRKNYAFEIQREKEEFEKVVKLNVEDIEKTKELENKHKQKIEQHRKNLLKQIHDREQEKIQERKKLFEEGIKLKQEELNRQKTLQETMKNKIDNLKAHNVPEKYVQGIERQLKLNK